MKSLAVFPALLLLSLAFIACEEEKPEPVNENLMGIWKFECSSFPNKIIDYTTLPSEYETYDTVRINYERPPKVIEFLSDGTVIIDSLKTKWRLGGDSLQMGYDFQTNDIRFSDSLITLYYEGNDFRTVYSRGGKERHREFMEADYYNQPFDFIDTRDGKEYRAVKIGDQVWMAENLAYKTKGSRCYGEGAEVRKDYSYSNDYELETLSKDRVQENCKTYGQLYDWETAMKACPEGWHLPTNIEWNKLYRYMDGTQNCFNNKEKVYRGESFKYLKAREGWKLSYIRRKSYELGGGELEREESGLDIFGFTALPGGAGQSSGGYFHGEGENAYWWTATEWGNIEGGARSVFIRNKGGLRRLSSNGLYSVRCVQGEPSSSSAASSSSSLTECPAHNPATHFCDTRDYKVYKKTTIGSQIWMAENLNYKDGGQCYHNYLGNCDKYGRLYDWKTAKKVCPSGWHLPANKEWDILFNFTGGVETAGKHLKAKDGWDGEDTYGFAALPGGSIGSNVRIGGIYINPGDNIYDVGRWWTATEGEDKDVAYSRYMRKGDMQVQWKLSRHHSSVRCVNDTLIKLPPSSSASASSSSVAKCPDNSTDLCDSRDGKTYRTVKIDKQTWMAENLNYAASSGRCYNNKPENCAKYGRLYTWETAMEACPAGWHLPKNSEWDALYNFINTGESAETDYKYKIVGRHLKSKSKDWNYYNGQSGGGKDTYGFTALPAGDGYYDEYSSEGNSFSDIGARTYWWSTYDSGSYGGSWTVNYIHGDLQYAPKSKTRLFSVRCVRD